MFIVSKNNKYSEKTFINNNMSKEIINFYFLIDFLESNFKNAIIE